MTPDVDVVQRRGVTGRSIEVPVEVKIIKNNRIQL